MKNPAPGYKVVFVDRRWYYIKPGGYCDTYPRLFRWIVVRDTWEDYKEKQLRITMSLVGSETE